MTIFQKLIYHAVDTWGIIIFQSFSTVSNSWQNISCFISKLNYMKFDIFEKLAIVLKIK